MDSKKVKEISFVVAILFIATLLFFFTEYMVFPNEGDNEIGISKLSAEDRLAGIITNDSRVRTLIDESYINLGGLFNETGESTLYIMADGPVQNSSASAQEIYRIIIATPNKTVKLIEKTDELPEWLKNVKTSASPNLLLLQNTNSK